MARSFISDLSITASNNTDMAGNGISGSDSISGGDNAIRALGSMLALAYQDAGGLGTVGGTGDAITLTAKQAWTGYGSSANQIAGGVTLTFKAGAANTGATTINVNSLGAKKIRRQGDAALAAGDIIEKGIYLLRYDSAYDSATGAWVLLNAGLPLVADAAAFRANTADKVLDTDAVWAAAAEVTLTDASTIAVDMSTFINAAVTLGNNRTLGQPSNPKVGQSGCIRVKQDGTGSRTLAYHADWEFVGGTAPTLSTTASAEDLLFYQVLASGRVFATLAKAVS
jgi:hypothetical protein